MSKNKNNKVIDILGDEVVEAGRSHFGEEREVDGVLYSEDLKHIDISKECDITRESIQKMKFEGFEIERITDSSLKDSKFAIVIKSS